MIAHPARADTGAGAATPAPRRIVFATVAAGGGHIATARAMAEAVEAHAPGTFSCSVHDLMLELGFARQDRAHKASWRWMLARPWTARTMQRVIDLIPTTTNTLLRLSLDGAARAAAQRFAHDPPDLIVANHAFTSVLLTRAQRRYGSRTPVLTFATEPLDASALWAEPDAERVVVPSHAAKGDLVRMRVPGERIDVVGYPVGRAFLQPPERGEARARLGLHERFTCLVSFGGEGIVADAGRVIDALLGASDPPTVVVVTGRNAVLAAALRARHHPHLVVYDYADDMATLLAAADVVIGKAGPASTMEALALGRPVLVTGFAAMNELKVLRFLERHGLGHDARHTGELARLVAGYRASPEELERVYRASRALDFAGQTTALARYLVDAASIGLARTRHSGPGLA